MNPYEILGVSKDTPIDEIKKIYRKKAKEYHPDVSNGDKDLEEKFKEVSQAYEILSNPNKKAQYDRFGTIGNEQRQNEHWGAFHDFFAGQYNQNKPQKRAINPDVRTSVRISLSESIFGCEKTDTIRRILACDKCQTVGVSLNSEEKCSSCNGKGRFISCPAPGTQIINICSACNGIGKTYKQCSECKGAGYFQKEEKVKIKIPKNLRANAVIRLQDKGNTIYQFNDRKYTGSHYLVINYPMEDYGIVKRGEDLFVDVQVTIDQILAEDEINVRLFDTKNILLKLKYDQDLKTPYVIKTDFLNGGSVFVKVLPKIPSKHIDEDKRKRLVSALREAYGEFESTISPTDNQS